MTHSEIQAIASKNEIDVGAHTLNHPKLTLLKSDEQYWEINKSRVILSEITAKPIKLFAYPYGDHDQSMISILQKVGFIGACTTKEDIVREKTNPFLLPRLCMRNFDADEFSSSISDSK